MTKAIPLIFSLTVFYNISYSFLLFDKTLENKATITVIDLKSKTCLHSSFRT